MTACASRAVAPWRRMVWENDLEKKAMVCKFPSLSRCATHAASAVPLASVWITNGMSGSNECRRMPSSNLSRMCSNASRSGGPKRQLTPFRVSRTNGSIWCANCGTNLRATEKMPTTCLTWDTFVGKASALRAAVFSSDNEVPSGEHRIPKNVTSFTRT